MYSRNRYKETRDTFKGSAAVLFMIIYYRKGHRRGEKNNYVVGVKIICLQTLYIHIPAVGCIIYNVRVIHYIYLYSYQIHESWYARGI